MRRSFFLIATTVVAAVSSGAGTASAQRINMPVGYRLTWIGAKWNVEAKVVDANGRPTATALRYRVSDPAVATVNGRGEVTARKPGATKVWAVSGKDSASALLIVEQWPARFAFSPATIRLDALGGKQALKVLASDSAGVPIVGGSSRVGTCRVVNERVASLVGSDIVAGANGSTWLRCSDRGLVDSIRVDVQQRATIATISNKVQLRGRTLSVGDTFTVKVSARDRNQKDVVDAKPTWASLTPYVFTIDPLSGRARTIGGGKGTALIQLGDISDSVSVDVSGPAYAPVSEEKVDSSATRSKAAINFSDVNAFENDQVTLTGTVTDSAGQPVPFSQLRVTAIDTSVVAVLDSGRVKAKKSGVTALWVTYARMRDSVPVTVRSRQSGVAVNTTADSGATAANLGNFVQYSIPDSTADSRSKRDSAMSSIRENTLLSARQRNFQLSGMALGAFAEHLVNDGTVVEDRSGPLYGGQAQALFFQRLELSGAYRTGSLSSTNPTIDPLKVTEAEGSMGFFPVPSVGIRGGVLLRGENNNISLQHWMIPKVSLVTRFGLIGDVFTTYAAVSLLPKASFTGIQGDQGSLFSRGGEAGLEFKTSLLNGGLTYTTERLTFDTSNRTESFSAIRIRFGFGR